MDINPTLSPRFFVYLKGYLVDIGLDPESIFTVCGVNCAADEELNPLQVSKASQIFELAAQESGDANFGMNMANQMEYESSGLLPLTVFAAPNVEIGLKSFVRYDKFIDPGIATEFTMNGKSSDFKVSLLDTEAKAHEQLYEYLVVFAIKLLRRATRQTIPLFEVCFKHKPSKPSELLVNLVEAPVKFEQAECKITFDTQFVKQPFVTANSLLFEIMTKALNTYFTSRSENYGLMEAVSREVIRQLSISAVNIDSVAESLSVSPRTLRRKLSEEGISFQSVKNTARENRAKYFLVNTNMPLSEIAFELGFSELSAFNRAFRAWCGESPQAYRKKLAE